MPSSLCPPIQRFLSQRFSKLATENEAILEVKATAGDTHLGGEDSVKSSLAVIVPPVGREHGVSASSGLFTFRANSRGGRAFRWDRARHGLLRTLRALRGKHAGLA